MVGKREKKTQERAKLLGISLFGPEPLGWVHLPLGDARTLALYGKNGAGKSKILNAAGRALRGEASGNTVGLLHFALARTSERDDLEAILARTLQSQIVKLGEAASRATMTAYFDDEIDVSVKQELDWISDDNLDPLVFEDLAVRYLDLTLFNPDGETWSDSRRRTVDIMESLATSMHVSLRATGTAESAAWSASLSGTRASKHYWDDVERNLALPKLRSAVIAAMGDPEQAKSAFNLMSERLPKLTFGSWASIKGAPSDVVEWPTWAPFPYLDFGTLTTLPIISIAPSTASDDLDTLTRSELFGGAHAFDPELATQTANRTGTLATESLQAVLGTGLRLRFALGADSDWFHGRLPHWELSSHDSPWLPLDSGSDAEQSWGRAAILIALRAASEVNKVAIALIDEPEQGLHPLLESKLPEALDTLSAQTGVSFIVSTHSPALLDDRMIAPHHVQRTGGVTRLNQVIPPSDAFEESLMRDQLGLRRSDALQLTRVFVLVEGLHDELVFQRQLADDIRSSRAKLIPLRGAKDIRSLAEARYLFEYSDADFILVIDGLPVDLIQKLIDKARAHIALGHHDAARLELKPLEEIRSGEAKWLRELLALGIENALLDRLHIHPLSRPDVITYLPAEAFVPGGDWDVLIPAWERSFGRATPTNLKGWLTGSHGAIIDPQRIAKAATDGPVHQEVAALGAKIRSVARSGGLTHLYLE